jgi:hypothetical protein
MHNGRDGRPVVAADCVNGDIVAFLLDWREDPDVSVHTRRTLTKAVDSLRTYETRVTNVREAKAVPHVGNYVGTQIANFLRSACPSAQASGAGAGDAGGGRPAGVDGENGLLSGSAPHTRSVATLGLRSLASRALVVEDSDEDSDEDRAGRRVGLDDVPRKGAGRRFWSPATAADVVHDSGGEDDDDSDDGDDDDDDDDGDDGDDDDDDDDEELLASVGGEAEREVGRAEPGAGGPGLDQKTAIVRATVRLSQRRAEAAGESTGVGAGPAPGQASGWRIMSRGTGPVRTRSWLRWCALWTTAKTG